MIIIPPTHTPALTAEALDPTRMTRHQIRDDMQTIQIGLHILERRLDMRDDDLQEELIGLRASLRKTLHVMESLVRLQQSRAAHSTKSS